MYARNSYGCYPGINSETSEILGSKYYPLLTKSLIKPGYKEPGSTNQTFLVVKPGLPRFIICAKSLGNQGIPGKPGYFKN